MGSRGLGFCFGFMRLWLWAGNQSLNLKPSTPAQPPPQKKKCFEGIYKEMIVGALERPFFFDGPGRPSKTLSSSAVLYILASGH